MAKQEIYISTDIEADGPIPGPHSMLSLGSIAFTREGAELGRFSANLEPLESASGHPTTMAWWDSQPAAWQALLVDRRPAQAVMADYLAWVKALPGKPVFVGFPVTYDFMFVYWYLIRFVGESPFSHSALDIKTLAMVALRCGYRDAVKRNMPRSWFGPQAHEHVALSDAVEQGELFRRIMAEIDKGRA